MTIAHDLTLVALGLPADRPVEHGDLSLALAGAEAIDLLDGGTLTLDGDLMVPGPRSATGDRLLDQAAAALTRREPHERVEDWLWRRGTGLTAAYVDDLSRIGLLGHAPEHHFLHRSAPSAPSAPDPSERRRTEEHRAAGEPVVMALLAVLQGEDTPPATGGVLAGDAVTTVLAAVGDAVANLEAQRLRRNVEDAAFDNMWRG